MKLRFYRSGKAKKKTYTLKKEISNRATEEAHYKFVRIPSVKLTSPMEGRK